MYTAISVVEEVRRIAKIHPDFIYLPEGTNCFYAPDDDNPYGCIIGFALRNLGSEEIDDDGYQFYSASHLPMISGDKNSYEKVWLNCVQNYQDAGETWADCVLKADEAFIITT